jgi:hypothetical protein
LVAAGCDWTQWGGGPAHIGSSFQPSFTSTTVPAIVASPVGQLPITGQVAVANGLVFAPRNDSLVAFDANTYGIVWTGTLPSGSTAGSVPAVDIDSNTVFIVVSMASNPVLLGFDVDGVRNCNTLLNVCAPLFRAQLGTTNGPATPPVVDGGKVFANGATSLYAFDAAGNTNCATSVGTHVCNPVWSAATGFAGSGIGPAVDSGVVHDPVPNGVRAFNAANGNVLRTDTVGAAVTATPSIADSRVFVPAGVNIAVFASNGCGGATCARSFTLARKTSDAAGNFMGTPAIDSGKVFATNSNGALYAWASNGCGGASCQPSSAVALNAPIGGSTNYSQSVALGSGFLFVLARRVVSGANHMVLFARAPSDLHELKNWDLGAADPAPGLASASVGGEVVYAPINGSLVAAHAPAVRPLASLSVSSLTLFPSFSSGTFDYVLRCAAGTNAVTINATAVAGGTVRLVKPITTQPSPSQSNPVNLAENQAAVVEATNAQGQAKQYWIRCLPNDFPTIDATPHPGAGTPTPGWYLTADFPNATTGAYAMILDTHGTPVWYKHVSTGNPTDVKFFGKNRVAFAGATGGMGGYNQDPNADYKVYNLENNQVTETIKAFGVSTDFHDMEPLPNGNRLVMSYVIKGGFDLTGLNATPAPGPNSTIADCEVQEVNPQGSLVWKWDASDHVDPVTENEFTPTPVTINNTPVYDVYHCNSIDPIPGGDVLVSLRHNNAVIRIRRSDGKIIWKLGGTTNSKDNAQHITVQNYPQVATSLQHDARFLPNGHVSVFDNQSLRAGPAQGVEFALDLQNGTAQPVFQFGSPQGKNSQATGSFRRYSDGHSVICWGITSAVVLNFSEVDAAGNDVLDVGFGTGNGAYRAVKAPPTRFDVNVLRANAGKP